MKIACECGKRYRVNADMQGRKIRCKACGTKFRIELEDSYVQRGVESDLVASRSGTAVASPPKRRTRTGRSSGEERRSSSKRERSSSSKRERSSSSKRERSSTKRESGKQALGERKTGKFPRKASGKLGEQTEKQTGKFPKKGAFPKKTGKFPKKGSGAFAKKSGSFNAPKKTGKFPKKGSGKLGAKGSGKLGAKGRSSARLRTAPPAKMPGLVLPALECLIGLGVGGALYFGATQATAGPLFDAGQQVGTTGALGIGGGLFGVGGLWLLLTLKKRGAVRAAQAAAAAAADDED